MRIIAMTVSFSDTLSIESNAKMNVMTVKAPCMSAGPYI